MAVRLRRGVAPRRPWHERPDRLRDLGYKFRTVERWVTEWVEVVE